MSKRAPPKALFRGIGQCRSEVRFSFGSFTVCVKSNSLSLLERLVHYYRAYPKTDGVTNITIYLIDSKDPLACSLNWKVLAREPGKSSLKERYVDYPNGRVIEKMRTGMTFWQGDSPLAVGPCGKHFSQTVNFVNNQLLNHFQHNGYLLGHAASFSKDNEAVVIAAQSGGGKSTLMLECLENLDTHFISNDRVLMDRDENRCRVLGVPKMPRVNPGTLVNSSRLNHLLQPNFRSELEQLSPADLWALEHKFDVDILQEYGANRVATEATLKRLILLDWSIHSNDKCSLCPVDLSSNPEQIDGLRKRPGPFYIGAPGHIRSSVEPSSAARYIDVIGDAEVYSLRGKVDFKRARTLLERLA